MESEKPRVRMRDVLREQKGLVLGTVTVFVLLGLMVAGIMARALPRTYETRVVFEPLPLGPGVVSAEPANVRDMLTSDRCLERVREEMDLNVRWSLDRYACIEVLREAVSVSVTPGGRMLECKVSHHNAVDARDIAAALPKAWAHEAAKIDDSVLESRIAALRHSRQKQEWIAEEAAGKLEKMKNYGGTDPESDADIHLQLANARDLAAATRQEELRLMVWRENSGDRLVLHEQAVSPSEPVAPKIEVIFARGAWSGLWVGLLVAVPASVVANRIRHSRKKPATTIAPAGAEW